MILESILSIQTKSASSGGKSREDVIYDIASSLEQKTPPVFDFDEIFKKYPTKYEESMNTVLIQEIIRYNRLLEAMKISLINVKKALKCLIVMSEEMEKLSNSLFDNMVLYIFLILIINKGSKSLGRKRLPFFKTSCLMNSRSLKSNYIFN